MNEQTAWSISLGRWFGVQVRLHAFFLGFAVFTLYLARQVQGGELFWVGVSGTAVLLVAVLLHEFGHVFATRHLDGQAERIVLGPWGGLEPVQPPWDARQQLVVWLAGPLMNLLVCLLLAPVVALACNVNPLHLLHPLNPVELTTGAPWQVAIKLAFWINWFLVVLNLIPAFPFDGGRAFVAGTMAFFPHVSQQRATSIVVGLAYVAAMLLVIIACFSFSAAPASFVPIWLALAVLAICLFFSAKQQESRDLQDDDEDEKNLFGYDFSQGYASLESSTGLQQSPAPHQGVLARWMHKRRQQRERRQQQREVEEDARLDAILARLHEGGMEGLTVEERTLLKRASARYRSRLRS